jgi:hypothetical protein
MSTLKALCKEARKAFEKQGIDGEFHGVLIKDKGVYLVYKAPNRRKKEVIWKEVHLAQKKIAQSR